MRVRRANSAFSIIEVMFAVIILGIGFMLVAAMFPVAIQQTQATVDEVNARACAANGAIQVATLLRSVHPSSQGLTPAQADGTLGILSTRMSVPAPNDHVTYQRIANLPNAGDIPAVVAPPDHVEAQSIRETVNAMTFSQQDPRYAWSMLYSCDQPAVGQPWNLNLIVFGLRATNASQCTEMTAFSDPDWDRQAPFGVVDYPWQAGPNGYDNAVIPCQVDTQRIPGSPTRLTFVTTDPNAAQAKEAAISGAVVVRQAAAAGLQWQIVRLGNIPEDDPGAWEVLAEPNDNPVAANETNVAVYLIGRGLRDPAAAWDGNSASPTYNPREGACQVSFVQRMATQLP